MQKKMINQKGFSLIELMMTMVVFSILLGLTTINFTSVQRRTGLSSTIETLLTDFSQQQIKAMVGDTEGRGIIDNYGIHFNSSSYTLFNGTYSATASSNFTVTLTSGQQFNNSFTNSEMKFQKGTGDMLNYSSLQNSLTITDTTTNEQKVIKFNRYGVVTSVN